LTPTIRFLGLFFALSLLVFGDKLILGEYALIRISDTFDSNVVEFKTVANLLFEHGLFGWYPHLAGGRPSHAFHFSPLYPLVIAAQFLPLWLIYAGMKALLMLTAGYGMFRFLRDYLGFEPNLALLAGIVFAFNSQTQAAQVVHVVFNFAFPLVFVWSLGIGGRGRYSWIAAALGLLLLSLLSYPVLTVPFYPVTQFLLIVFLNPFHKTLTRRLLVRWTLFWSGYALIFLPLGYALLDFSGESQRAYSASTLNLFSWLYDAGRQSPAASLLLFPIGGALALAYHSSLVRRVLLLNFIPILISAFFYSSASNVVPQALLGKTEFHLFFFVQNFLLTILAFVGLRFVLSRKDLLTFYLLGGIVLFGVTSPYLYRASPYKTLLFLNLLIPLGICLYLRRTFLLESPGPAPRRPWLLTAAFVLVLLGIRVNIFHEGQENVSYKRYFGNNLVLAESFARKDVGRVVTLGFHPALARNLGAETADGYSAVFSSRYKAVWRVAISKQLKDEEQRRRFDWYRWELNSLNGQTLREFTHRVYNLKHCPTPFEESLEWHAPLFLAFNVTAVVSLRPVRELEAISERVVSTGCPERSEGVITFNRLRRFFSPAPLWVYFLKDTFERGYLVDRAEVLDSDEAVLGALGRRTVAEFRSSVLLSAQDGNVSKEEPALAGTAGTKGLTLTEYGPDRLVFDVHTPRPAYLVVSNNYTSKWTARVGGRPVPLLRANHAFQAVRIDAPGRHEVVFEYKDELLWLSYAAVPLGLACIAAAARPIKEMTEGETA